MHNLRPPKAFCSIIDEMAYQVTSKKEKKIERQERQQGAAILCQWDISVRPTHVGPCSGHTWAHTHVSNAQGQLQSRGRVAVIIRADSVRQTGCTEKREK
ncbi:hypothetical protein GBA52_009528 [Prunus armeniaca]|nr:hypothetical protein GBA52_009528 [Prunus armeniaca]